MRTSRWAAVVAIPVALILALPASAQVDRMPLIKKDGHAASGCHMRTPTYEKDGKRYLGVRAMVRCDQNWDRLHVTFKLFRTHRWDRTGFMSFGFGGDAKGRHRLRADLWCGSHEHRDRFELRMFAVAQNDGHHPYIAYWEKRFTIWC